MCLNFREVNTLARSMYVLIIISLLKDKHTVTILPIPSVFERCFGVCGKLFPQYGTSNEVMEAIHFLFFEILKTILCFRTNN